MILNVQELTSNPTSANIVLKLYFYLDQLLLADSI